MNTLFFDLELIKKYDVSAPRYTSYPPATQFTAELSSDLLYEKIRENNKTEENKPERDLSLYFHLPFCHSLCWYCGCTTVITRQQKKSELYIDYLKKELALITPVINPKRQVKQLHFGGGTPTFLTPDELRALGCLIHEHFQLSADAEAGVEIDPRRLTYDHLKALHESGFNRASIGVQDHDPKVQAAVNRIQPYTQTKRTIDWIRAVGFNSVNLDLIYGLPYQTVESFEQTLNDILKLNPDRLAVFNYAHMPWIKPAQRMLTDQMLPSAEVKLQLLKLTVEKLTSEGFVYIGMDHFAKETDELAIAQKQKTLQRNFQGYSTHGDADIYSFGLSSISQIDSAYWQNIKELTPYYEALDQGKQPLARGYLMTEDDKIRRHTIMRLMCDLSLDYKAMSAHLNLNFKEYFANELATLKDLEADGLLIQSEEELQVTDLGRLLIRNIAMRFDAYQTVHKKNSFSRTI